MLFMFVSGYLQLSNDKRTVLGKAKKVKFLVIVDLSTDLFSFYYGMSVFGIQKKTRSRTTTFSGLVNSPLIFSYSFFKSSSDMTIPAETSFSKICLTSRFLSISFLRSSSFLCLLSMSPRTSLLLRQFPSVRLLQRQVHPG